MILKLNVITGKETKPVKIQWGPGCMMIDMPENKATLVTILGAAADKGILVTETSEQIEALISEQEGAK